MNGTRAVFRFTFFARGCPGVSTPFAEKMILVPFYCLYSVVKDQLVIFRWVDFWALYPVSLMYLSVLLPIPHCLDHCSFLCSKSYNQVCQFFDFVLSALFFPLFHWLLDTDAAVNLGFFLLLSSPGSSAPPH